MRYKTQKHVHNITTIHPHHRVLTSPPASSPTAVTLPIRARPDSSTCNPALGLRDLCTDRLVLAGDVHLEMMLTAYGGMGYALVMGGSCPLSETSSRCPLGS